MKLTIRKLYLITFLLFNLTQAYSLEPLANQNLNHDIGEGRRTERLTGQKQLINELKPLEPTANPNSFLQQDAPTPFHLTTQKEDQTDRENNNYSNLSPLAKDERAGLGPPEESSKLVLNDSSDPLHIQTRRPKKTPLFMLTSIKKLATWIFVLFTTRNPVWRVSFKIFKGLFSFFFRFCYVIIDSLFSFLTHLMVWFWDEILFPMTFPIRLVFWLVVLKPLSLTQTILKKLKPVILFLISAITMGILIGMIGSSTHLWIGDWLFPLHHLHKSQKQKKKEVGLIDRQKRREQTDGTGSGQRVDQPSSKSSRHAPEIKNERGKVDEGKMREGSDSSSPSAEADLSEDQDEDWSGYKLETELSSTLEPHQTRYTSAVQKLNSRPTASSSTRQRHQQHHLSSEEEPSSPSPSILPDTLAQSNPDSVSILKTTPPLDSSPSSPTRKKKVTFKTD